MESEGMRMESDGMTGQQDGTVQAGTCPGTRPQGYGELFVFVPEMGQIVRIAEGTGDNLLREDEEDGYVDYIYYEQHGLSDGMPVVDGGMVLLKGMFRELFRCTADCIPRVLDMAYGTDTLGCTILAIGGTGHGIGT